MRRRLARALPALLIMAVACTQAAGHSSDPTGTPTGTPSLAVPDVEGRPIARAKGVLRDARLRVRTEIRLTDAFEAGKIVGQRPPPGTDVMPRHTIVLVVARPRPVITDVLGLSLSRARIALQRYDFDVRVRRQISSKPVGTIIKMSPDGGTSARPGRNVALVVAKAPSMPVAPPSNCQGYSPCIAPGSDVDCAGGSGDGPRWVGGPVRVTGSDPYGLDGYDNDGWGCE